KASSLPAKVPSGYSAPQYHPPNLHLLPAGEEDSEGERFYPDPGFQKRSRQHEWYERPSGSILLSLQPEQAKSSDRAGQKPLQAKALALQGCLSPGPFPLPQQPCNPLCDRAMAWPQHSVVKETTGPLVVSDSTCLLFCRE